MTIAAQGRGVKAPKDMRNVKGKEQCEALQNTKKGTSMSSRNMKYEMDVRGMEKTLVSRITKGTGKHVVEKDIINVRLQRRDGKDNRGATQL